MVADFFATTVDDWDDPAGMLHAYLVPDDAAVGRLRPILDALAPLPFVAAQPPGALHATVQRFPRLVRDLSEADREGLREAAAMELGGLRAAAAEASGLEEGPEAGPSGSPAAATGPVALSLGGVVVTDDSVVLRAAPDGRWRALTAAVRRAAAAVLGEEAARYAPPPVPHLTLAYGTAAGDDAEIREALAGLDAANTPFGEIAFPEVAWCAVHQHRDRGTYTFETLFTTPVG